MPGSPRSWADLAWGLAAVLGAGVAALVLLAPVTGVRATYVSSGSMSPTLDVGALLLTHRVDVASVRLGDVVAVETATGSRVVHRAVGTTADGLVLRGDANRESDPRPYDVAHADRVLLHVPTAGRAVAAFGAVPRWLLLGGFAGLAVLGWRAPARDRVDAR